MSKRITSVVWEATGLPSGIEFNSKNGTFTGTPDAVGEYTIPVKVTTNYGSDEKDVKFNVYGESYPVYAVGTNAEKWSEGAEADGNGFRKLNMPDVYKLVSCTNGFGAKATDGNFYRCGAYDITTTAAPSKAIQTVSKPTIATYGEEALDDIRFGYLYKTHASGTLRKAHEYCYYVLKKVKKGNTILLASRGYIYDASFNSSGQVTSEYTSESYASMARETVINNCSGLPDVPHISGNVIGYHKNDNTKGHRETYKTESYRGKWYSEEISFDKKIKKMFLGDTTSTSYQVNTASRYTYFTEDNKLRDTTGEEKEFPYGEIKDVWCYNAMVFALNGENELYAIGGNASNQLGLPESSYTEWEKVGLYDVKKMEMRKAYTFMLTKDGKLYFAGSERTGIGIGARTEFSQIYPEYYFTDIVANDTTLVVTVKE